MCPRTVRACVRAVKLFALRADHADRRIAQIDLAKLARRRLRIRRGFKDRKRRS